MQGTPPRDRMGSAPGSRGMMHGRRDRPRAVSHPDPREWSPPYREAGLRGPIAVQDDCFRPHPSPVPTPDASTISPLSPIDVAPPGDEPRLVSSPWLPAFLVAQDLQPPDQPGQLAILQQVARCRPRMAQEVAAGRMGDDQQPARGQLGREGFEERAPE